MKLANGAISKTEFLKQRVELLSLGVHSFQEMKRASCDFRAFSKPLHFPLSA
jgi:hypothetical protein